MTKILKYVFKETEKYLEQFSKTERKKKGQFFTSRETAEYMASLFKINDENDEVSILDPGSGTGILSVAFAERLLNESKTKKIHITCYETDENVLPILKKNLLFLEKNSKNRVHFKVLENDYLISQLDEYNNFEEEANFKKFDYIIGNPPYKKLPKSDKIALQMQDVIYGAPNLYFLFASMSLFNLNSEGEMVYIIPRSWTSGLYFSAFRKKFLSIGKINHVHLFVSRDKVFSNESVLQETIIVKVTKTSLQPEFVEITSSNSNHDFNNLKSLSVQYKSIVGGEAMYVFLPTTEDEVKKLDFINSFTTTFKEVGFKMKTGIVVDFRQKKLLRKEKNSNTIPLFYSQHIRNGIVSHFSSDKGYDWISDEKQGLLQPNKNYVFCKRFTAKEEKRRLQCGIYLKSSFLDYENISTQNKINYIDDLNGLNLTISEVYGIYGLLNSTMYDTYYRILNGSTQVNSTEINNMPVPSREKIDKLGELLIEQDDLSTNACDQILYKVIDL